MKSLIGTAVIAVVVAAPVAVLAQTNQPLTRAEVRQQLVQIEKAGYNPARSNPNEYPANIQAAQARVAVQNSAVGGVTGAASEQGHAAAQ